MVVFLKPKDNPEQILGKIEEFLAARSLEIKQEKTKVVASTDGFDFLGWNFAVKPNGKFICRPSRENYQAFRSKVKAIVNNSNYGAKVKAKKLAPIVRGWRRYHQYCDMSKHNLWGMTHDAFLRFLKEKRQTRHTAERLVNQAFPSVKWAANKHVMVSGKRTPFDGDVVYWSKRNSKHYDNHTAKALRKQDHTCGYCGHHFIGNETVELHHIDGNHNNWRPKNLVVIHRSCHQYVHMGKIQMS